MTSALEPASPTDWGIVVVADRVTLPGRPTASANPRAVSLSSRFRSSSPARTENRSAGSTDANAARSGIGTATTAPP